MQSIGNDKQEVMCAVQFGMKEESRKWAVLIYTAYEDRISFSQKVRADGFGKE